MSRTSKGPRETYPSLPPEAWLPAQRLAQSVKGSMDRFLRVEAAGGIILLIVATVALTWANSPWSSTYDQLWHTPISIGVGTWRIEESLHFWINDLLMTAFFLLVGLEIKREIVEGALSDVRRATLPIAGAIGGMLVPALMYTAINLPAGTVRGWGVPMATDIAFAVGVLTLLGSRIPATLRVLLLALAIIDDIGAMLVIALFYSTGFAFDGLLIAAAGILMLFALLKIGVRPSFLFTVPILIIWVGMLRTGVHPTIAGVIAGLCAPARSWFGKEGFLETAREALDDFQARIDKPHKDHDLLDPLSRLEQARREALSPALRVEMALHPWVAYFIMPLFALANAGVHLGGVELGSLNFAAVFGGVTVGLVIGKPLGIMAASWIAVRLNLCSLPDGVDWRGMFVMGSVAGIGFTMAIFVAELAFEQEELLAVAKLAVLLATALAAAIGLVAGWKLFSPTQPGSLSEITASDAEQSSEYWTGDVPPAND